MELSVSNEESHITDLFADVNRKRVRDEEYETPRKRLKPTISNKRKTPAISTAMVIYKKAEIAAKRLRLMTSLKRKTPWTYPNLTYEQQQRDPSLPQYRITPFNAKWVKREIAEKRATSYPPPRPPTMRKRIKLAYDDSEYDNLKQELPNLEAFPVRRKWVMPTPPKYAPAPKRTYTIQTNPYSDSNQIKLHHLNDIKHYKELITIHNYLRNQIHNKTFNTLLINPKYNIIQANQLLKRLPSESVKIFRYIWLKYRVPEHAVRSHLAAIRTKV